MAENCRYEPVSRHLQRTLPRPAKLRSKTLKPAKFVERSLGSAANRFWWTAGKDPVSSSGPSIAVFIYLGNEGDDPNPLSSYTTGPDRLGVGDSKLHRCKSNVDINSACGWESISWGPSGGNPDLHVCVRSTTFLRTSVVPFDSGV